MQIYFILLLFYIDTNSIFYYIYLNFLHYPKFNSFCIILPIFSCLSKKPTGLGFLKKTWVFLNPALYTVYLSVWLCELYLGVIAQGLTVSASA